MTELVDVIVSKAVVRNDVQVRVLVGLLTIIYYMMRLSNDILKEISIRLGYPWKESNETLRTLENRDLNNNYLIKLRKEDKIKCVISKN